MIEQMNVFASEVTRVAREVGTEGKLGGQARVPGVSRHVEGPHRQRQLDGRQPDRRRCATSPRSRPRSRTATCRARSRSTCAARSSQLKDAINTMVDQLRSFASEVTRVAREVGTEGKLGGQADVPRRRGHVEGPDRQRELDGREPHRPGAQHRRGHDRGRARRPVAQDHGRREGRDPRAQEHHQHDGRSAQRVRRRRSRASRARSAPKASSAARPTCRASPARGRT